VSGDAAEVLEPTEGVLDAAVAALAGEYELEDADRPALDHDTKGVPGAAETVPVLMDKVANSAVFVADVTPTARQIHVLNEACGLPICAKAT
jgi:hypothetical protein